MADGIKSKHYILKNHFDGYPTESNFEIVEENLTVGDGEILVENLFLSVDPYMRPYSKRMKEGSKMIGTGLGKVIASKNDKFPVGSLVVCNGGWSTHVLATKQIMETSLFGLLPKEIEPYLSYALGALGLTGLTAYFGFLDVCKPKAGEMVFVNAAAGATGSVVGQIAKIMGCQVVGCAGSDTKVAFLQEMGFDGAFNYKTTNLDEKLKELCPNGIDCFFDNVGGSMFDTAMTHMKQYGRISLCGSISTYNEKGESNENALSNATGPYVHSLAVPKELKIQGFIVLSYKARFGEALKELQGWIKEGKIKVREVVHEGFDQMPTAFMSLFKGENIGKVVVKVN